MTIVDDLTAKVDKLADQLLCICTDSWESHTVSQGDPCALPFHQTSAGEQQFMLSWREAERIRRHRQDHQIC